MPILPTLLPGRFRTPRLMLTRALLPAALGAILAACGSQEQQPAAAPTTPAAATAPAASVPEISPALATKRDSFARQPVTLFFERQQWKPSASELGATVTAEANGLGVVVDQAKLRTYLEKLAPKIARAPTDAQLALEGSEVVVSPATVGRELDVEATLDAVTGALERATPQRLELATEATQPRIDDAAAQAAQSDVEALLAEPFEVVAGKKTYTLDAEDLAPLVALKPSASGDELQLFDEARLSVLVGELADASEQPAREPRVDWNGGDLRIIEDGKNGTRVDEAEAVSALLDAFASGARGAKLPLRELAPQVTADKLDSLGIKEVVSAGKSDFTGSAAYRVTNILAGMKILNGILIPPGGEFSFNSHIGEIDASNGFVEGYAIIQGRTQLEFGGGICQDSTTVFRAAFWAGLPITERKEHTYYISWYDKYGLGPQGNGPGLDAAIFTGVQDLRFVNDTGAWLLMQTSANAKSGLAQVTLYGTKPDREVSISHEIVKRTPAITIPEYYPDPKQPQGSMKRTDTARGGMEIRVYRTVVENGVKREPELFSTSFRPWPNKYAVNPADLNAEGIPVFLAAPTATITPTIDPALVPTIDPNAPPAPTADPNAPPAPTADPNVAPPAIPTADPNLFPPAPTPDPNQVAPAPTADPNAQPAPPIDPNAQPVPPIDPNAQPPADPNAAPPAG